MARSGRTPWFVGRTTSVHSKIAGKYAHVHWSSLICWTRPTCLSAVALYICCSYFVHRPFIFVRAPLTVDLAVIPPYEAISGHHPWPSPSGTGETVGTSGWSLEGLRVGSGWGKEQVFLHHDELLDESPFHPFLHNMISLAKHDLLGHLANIIPWGAGYKKIINLKLGDGDYGIGFNSLNIFW